MAGQLVVMSSNPDAPPLPRTAPRGPSTSLATEACRGATLAIAAGASPVEPKTECARLEDASRTAAASDAWVEHALPASDSKWIWVVRIAGIFGIGAASGAVVAAALAWMPLWELAIVMATAAAVPLLAAAAAYWQDPLVSQHRRLAARLVAERQRLSDYRRGRDAHRAVAAQLQADHEAKRIDLDARRERMKRGTAEDVEHLQRAASGILAKIARQRQELNRRGELFARRWLAISQARRARYAARRRAVRAAYDVACQERLAAYQASFLATFLAQHTLEQAELAGIGDKLIAKLAACGVQTAADATFEQLTGIEGCGPKKVQTILAWRESLAAKAQAQLPLVLPEAELILLEQELSMQQVALDAEEKASEDKHRERRAAASKRYQAIEKKLWMMEKRVRARSRREQRLVVEQSLARFRETARPLIDSAARLRTQYFDALEAARAADAAAEDLRPRVTELRSLAAATREYTLADYLKLVAWGESPRAPQPQHAIAPVRIAGSPSVLGGGSLRAAA